MLHSFISWKQLSTTYQPRGVAAAHRVVVKLRKQLEVRLKAEKGNKGRLYFPGRLRAMKWRENHRKHWAAAALSGVVAGKQRPLEGLTVITSAATVIWAGRSTNCNFNPL